ncbi:hypothetical protein O181_033605 [Austropuccinia psidii MF-1]|uniref:polynucleotide adenylyltransferase n=1 Tax=Austropuccinia psidii MF-1 TaxID=1389203 RepID=A0A9Q3D1I9_9BASI|nr:hypothetical protein [Austropuccinia psidii MF-1]
MGCLATALELAGFQNVRPIQFARTPIVKFKSPDGSMSVDLNCNNLLGCRNSQLLKAYYDIAPEVIRPLGMSIKLWAKLRGYCDPSGRQGPTSASSYTLILLLIAYLQSIKFLPNLQDQANLKEALGPNYQPHYVYIFSDLKLRNKKSLNAANQSTTPVDTSFLNTSPQMTNWKKPKVEDLSKLFLGFFQYYDTFDFDRCLVSIRDGHPLPRKSSSKCHPANDINQLPSLETLSISSGDEEVITYVPFDLRSGIPEAQQREMDALSLNRSLVESISKRPLNPSNKSSSNWLRDHFEKSHKTSSDKAIYQLTPREWDESLVVVDPFLINRNTAGNIKAPMAKEIRQEFRRARKILEGGGGLAELCHVDIDLQLRRIEAKEELRKRRQALEFVKSNSFRRNS